MRLAGRVVSALLGVAAATAIYVYLTIPDVRPLRTTNPTTTAFMELRAREARAAGQTPRRDQRWVGYNRISQNLKRAVLVAEDSAFWDHEGLDFDQIKESMEVNFERGEFVRGASTITQQLAKNLYLSPSRNPMRKLRELFITRRLEAELSKQRILELYLNLIEWGSGIYGAEAAARRYFGKPASALTADESALLAGAIINPRVLNPAQPTARLHRRQAMIRKRMGAVTPPPPIPTAQIPDPESGPAVTGEMPGQPVSPEAPPPEPMPFPAPIAPDEPPAEAGPPAIPPTDPPVLPPSDTPAPPP